MFRPACTVLLMDSAGWTLETSSITANILSHEDLGMMAIIRMTAKALDRAFRRIGCL